MTIQQISCKLTMTEKMNLNYYYSKSGKNLILDYIDSLPNAERIDGYSVLECLEEGKIEQVLFKH